MYVYIYIYYFSMYLSIFRFMYILISLCMLKKLNRQVLFGDHDQASPEG